MSEQTHLQTGDAEGELEVTPKRAPAEFGATASTQEPLQGTMLFSGVQWTTFGSASASGAFWPQRSTRIVPGDACSSPGTSETASSSQSLVSGVSCTLPASASRSAASSRDSWLIPSRPPSASSAGPVSAIPTPIHSQACSCRSATSAISSRASTATAAAKVSQAYCLKLFNLDEHSIQSDTPTVVSTPTGWAKPNVALEHELCLEVYKNVAAAAVTPVATPKSTALSAPLDPTAEAGSVSSGTVCDLLRERALRALLQGVPNGQLALGLEAALKDEAADPAPQPIFVPAGQPESVAGTESEGSVHDPAAVSQSAAGLWLPSIAALPPPQPVTTAASARSHPDSGVSLAPSTGRLLFGVQSCIDSTHSERIVLGLWNAEPELGSGALAHDVALEALGLQQDVLSSLPSTARSTTSQVRVVEHSMRMVNTAMRDAVRQASVAPLPKKRLVLDLEQKNALEAEEALWVHAYVQGTEIHEPMASDEHAEGEGEPTGSGEDPEAGGHLQRHSHSDSDGAAAEKPADAGQGQGQSSDTAPASHSGRSRDGDAATEVLEDFDQGQLRAESEAVADRTAAEEEFQSQAEHAAIEAELGAGPDPGREIGAAEDLEHNEGHSQEDRSYGELLPEFESFAAGLEASAFLEASSCSHGGVSQDPEPAPTSDEQTGDGTPLIGFSVEEFSVDEAVARAALDMVELDANLLCIAQGTQAHEEPAALRLDIPEDDDDEHSEADRSLAVSSAGSCDVNALCRRSLADVMDVDDLEDHHSEVCSSVGAVSSIGSAGANELLSRCTVAAMGQASLEGMRPPPIALVLTPRCGSTARSARSVVTCRSLEEKLLQAAAPGFPETGEHGHKHSMSFVSPSADGIRSLSSAGAPRVRPAQDAGFHQKEVPTRPPSIASVKTSASFESRLLDAVGVDFGFENGPKERPNLTESGAFTPEHCSVAASSFLEEHAIQELTADWPGDAMQEFGLEAGSVAAHSADLDDNLVKELTATWRPPVEDKELLDCCSVGAGSVIMEDKVVKELTGTWKGATVPDHTTADFTEASSSLAGLQDMSTLLRPDADTSESAENFSDVSAEAAVDKAIAKDTVAFLRPGDGLDPSEGKLSENVSDCSSGDPVGETVAKDTVARIQVVDDDSSTSHASSVSRVSSLGLAEMSMAKDAVVSLQPLSAGGVSPASTPDSLSTASGQNPSETAMVKDLAIRLAREAEREVRRQRFKPAPDLPAVMEELPGSFPAAVGPTLLAKVAPAEEETLSWRASLKPPTRADAWGQIEDSASAKAMNARIESRSSSGATGLPPELLPLEFLNLEAFDIEAYRTPDVPGVADEVSPWEQRLLPSVHRPPKKLSPIVRKPRPPKTNLIQDKVAVEARRAWRLAVHRAVSPPEIYKEYKHMVDPLEMSNDYRPHSDALLAKRTQDRRAAYHALPSRPPPGRHAQPASHLGGRPEAAVERTGQSRSVLPGQTLLKRVAPGQSRSATQLPVLEGGMQAAQNRAAASPGPRRVRSSRTRLPSGCEMLKKLRDGALPGILAPPV